MKINVPIALLLYLPKTNARANLILKDKWNFIRSVSSYDGKSNPHIHTPATTSVVKLGPWTPIKLK